MRGCSLTGLLILAILWTLLAPGLPLHVALASAGANQAILYSLDPTRSEEEPGLHGFRILGQTTVRGQEKNAVMAALRLGVSTAPPWRASCFNPRHAIRLEGSEVVDLVICYECLVVQVYRDGRPSGGAGVSALGSGVLNEILWREHVPIAP